MNNIISYLKKSFMFKDSSECVECNADAFNNSLFNNLIQDGFIFISNASHDNIVDKTFDSVRINNSIIARNNKPREIEWLNHDSTASFVYNNNPIYRRFVPLPVETIDHRYIIQSIIQETRHLFPSVNSNYIEYGTRNGYCIEHLASYVSNVYGIDTIDYTPTNKNIHFYKMLTDEFSNTHLKNVKYCYAFIDADHSSKQVFIDFEHIFNHIEIGGFIFLHDTYPCEEELLMPTYCNDCYKTPLLIKQKYSRDVLEIITIPINPGLTIIRKLKNVDMMDKSKIPKIKYYLIHNLDLNRKSNLLREFKQWGFDLDNIKWMEHPNKDEITDEFIEQLIIKIPSYSSGIFIHPDKTRNRKGMVCCSYKHYMSLKDIADNDYDYGIIMEDNTWFKANIPEKVSIYIKQLNEIYGDWDILFDGTWAKYAEGQTRPDLLVYPKTNEITGQCHGGTNTAVFYLVTKECAKKLVEHYIPFNDAPDMWMNELFRKLNIKSFWVEPSVVYTEPNHDSTTQS